MEIPRDLEPQCDVNDPCPASCQASLRATLMCVVAVGLLAGMQIWSVVGESSSRLVAVDVLMGVVSCALVPVVLRRPVVGAVTLAVLAAVSPAATPAATFATLHVAQRRRFAVALGVGGCGVAAHLVRGAWRPIAGLPYGWWVFLVLLAHAALVGWGAWWQARRRLIASLNDRVRRAESEQERRMAQARAAERARIAREMHDVLAHRLSLVATYAGALEYRPDAPPEQLARAAGVIRTSVHQALDELRDVIMVLRDDASGDDVTAGRPQPVLADLQRLLAECQDAGADVVVQNSVPEDALPASASRTAYRIVQEGLTNARKHAAGQPVRVTIEGAPGTRLAIRLSNPVPDATSAPLVPGTGTGLVGLAERTRLAGGGLDHETTPTGEFRLSAWLPWPA